MGEGAGLVPKSIQPLLVAVPHVDVCTRTQFVERIGQHVWTHLAYLVSTRPMAWCRWPTLVGEGANRQGERLLATNGFGRDGRRRKRTEGR